MTDFFFQMGLSNACISLALAIVAMVVGAKARRPHLAHMLWLLVFIKLVTPPIVTIPIVTIPQQPETAVAINEHSRPGPPLANSREFDVDAQPAASLSSRIGSVAWNHARVWLPPIWLLGSVVVFAWSLVRVCRFSRLLAAESEVAPQELQTAAVKIARRLRLNTIPTIHTTPARLSPLVWWAGGKVRIVIPTALLEKMDAQQSQWILAHELAHVRRRDYLVRWLEWLACVCFWWNPVVWWARHHLRANEELCCDALVISSLKPRPLTYANSLLTAVEYLACPAIRPPAMASEINSGGFFERRFKMIVSETPNRVNSRWLQACVLLCAMVVLPLGIASAQDYEAVGKRLRAAVKASELTPQQARAMMGVLKKEAGRKEVDIDAIGRRIRAAVQAGKLTKEEGRAKMAAIRKGAEKKETDIDAIGRRIRAAVQAGKLTKEEGRAKMAAIRKGAEKKETDIDAIGRRIRAAVQAGKLTKEEGRAKMAAIRKGADKKDQDSDRVKTYLMKVRKELGAAVEAGRISREDAKKRYKAAEKGIKERMAAGRGERGSKRITREDYTRAAADIRKAVAEGKISGEDARARLGGMRKMMAGQGQRQRDGERRRITREDYARVEARLRKGVEEGKISREDARARLEGMRKMMAERSERGERSITVEEYKRAEAKMRKMVEDGKAKPEDVERRLIEMRKMMAERGERGGRERDPKAEYKGFERRIKAAVREGKMTRVEAGEQLEGFRRRIEMAEQGERGSKRISREDFRRAAGEIRKAIAEGKITEEQGRAKLAAMRKMIAEKREGTTKRDVDWEGIKRRIEGAVKSGKMTREEADAKYKEIRERMAGRRER